MHPPADRPIHRGWAAPLLLAFALVPILIAGCSSGGDAGDEAKLTVYSDQHAELVQALTDAYTTKTGVEFNVQQDATVGQIEAEGDASPADVFLSEDPGPIAQLGAKGLLSPVATATLAQVPAHLSSGDGLWVAYAARARVLFYNPDKIAEAQLPRTLADIASPRYKGTFAWAPSGAFVATVQYLLDTEGVDRTTAFLKALKANGTNEQTNGNVRDTVEAGRHAMGLSNHYYWWVLATEKGGPNHLTSRIHHFPVVDPGNLVMSSGAGVLASSPRQEQAAAFLRWLTAKDGGQAILSGTDVNASEAQYPVAMGTSSPVAGSLSDIKSPRFDMDKFADQEQAEVLLKSLGMSN